MAGFADDPEKDAGSLTLPPIKMHNQNNISAMPQHLWVFCADIGSVEKGRFGWFGCGPDGRPMRGDQIAELADTVSEKITCGKKIALGFECPLYVPVRENPMLLTKARTGESNRSWSAGAGCGALATGLVEITWLLEKIRANTPATEAFLDWGKFKNANAGLFLWEAFVSGKAKGSGHADDAKIAVEKFREALPNPDTANAIVEKNVLSLVGASMLRTGWSTNAKYLSEPCLVIKA